MGPGPASLESFSWAWGLGFKAERAQGREEGIQAENPMGRDAGVRKSIEDPQALGGTC